MVDFKAFVKSGYQLAALGCYYLIMSAPAFGQQQTVTIDQEDDWLCSITLGIGITLNERCVVKIEILPPDDKAAYDLNFTPPPAPIPPPMPPVVIKEDPPPPPAPAAPPPPQIIERVVEKIIYKDPPPPPIKQDRPQKQQLRAAIAARLSHQGKLGLIMNDQGADHALLPALADFPRSGFSRNQAGMAAVMPPPKGVYQADKAHIGYPVDNSKLLTVDRVITGILETGINTQLASTKADENNPFSAPIVIQVSRNIFGYHGKEILIPQGSRVLCHYIGPDQAGVSRIGINCYRILIAGSRAEIYDINAVGISPQGHDGIAGTVDNRFFEKYGSAFVLAGISSAVRLSTAIVPSDDDNESAAEILDQGSQELSEKLGEITASILEQSVNLNPIITVPQGTRIHIRALKDLYLTPRNITASPKPSQEATAGDNQ